MPVSEHIPLFDARTFSLEAQQQAELEIIQNRDQSEIDLACAKMEYQEATRHLMEAQTVASESLFHRLKIDAGLALAEKEFKEARRVLDIVKAHYGKHDVYHSSGDSVKWIEATERPPTVTEGDATCPVQAIQELVTPLSNPRALSPTRHSSPLPLAIFFAQYTDFNYNPANSATAEFSRLCSSYGWRRDVHKKRAAKKGFQDALTMQFNDNYGTDVNDLTKWQALCARLGMDPVPEYLSECREAVRNKHVNLVDLVDNFGTRKKARIFPTVLALSEYTKKHGKFFPRHNAHAGNLLKFLLRQIMIPELSNEGENTRGCGRSGRVGHRRHRA